MRRPSPAGHDLHPGTAHIIAAMNAARVSRLIWISSHGIGDARGHSGFLFERIFVPWRLRAEFADKERQETPGHRQRPGLDHHPAGPAYSRARHRKAAGSAMPAGHHP